MFLMQLRLALAAALLACATAVASPTTSPATPATAPAAWADARVSELIQQLGHEQFATREAAAAELQKLGAAALPALKEAAATSDDAEVKARSQALVTSIEKQLAANPGWRVGRAPPFGARRVQVTIRNGLKETLAQEAGRTVRILEDAQGVTLTVQEMRDGKEVVTEYNAASPEELRKSDPEAYALYERYGNRGGVVLVPPVGPPPPPAPMPPVPPVPPVRPVPPVAPGVGQDMQQHLEEMLKDAPMPDDMKQRILEQNRRFEKIHERLVEQQLEMQQRMEEARRRMEERMWPHHPQEP